jgi:hypothetical protein
MLSMAVPVFIQPKDFRPWLSGEAGARIVEACAGQYAAPVAGIEARERTGNVDDLTLIKEIALNLTRRDIRQRPLTAKTGVRIP